MNLRRIRIQGIGTAFPRWPILLIGGIVATAGALIVAVAEFDRSVALIVATLVVLGGTVALVKGYGLQAWRPSARARLAEAWLDGLPDSVAVLDRHANIVAVNAAWRRFGQENGLIADRGGVGQNYLSHCGLRATPDEQLKQVQQGVLRVLSGEAKRYSHVYACHSPTQQRWFRMEVLPATHEGDSYFIVSHQDISDLRRAEESSRCHETRFRSLFHGTHQPMLLINTAFVEECNAAALQLFDVRSVDDIAEVPQEMASQIARAFEMGNACYEWECRRADGKRTPVEVYLTAIELAEGRFLLATLTDLTERKRLALELRNINQRFEQDLKARIQTEKVLRSTAAYLDVYHKIVDRHAIVAETDNAGNIVHANDAFCKISGYTREELIGKNHRILNSGLHPKSMWRDMFRQVVTEGVWHGEVCNRSKKGELYWVDTTVVPLLNDLGKVKGYFAIRTDITGLKKAQAAAEAANIAKSEFLANMSHEIRTPMTAILGFADLIADESIRCEPEKWREFVGTIKRNGEHLLSIINDILDLSKIEANKLVLEKLCANTRGVIDSVIELMMIKANGKGLQLRAHIDGNVPDYIHTDPTRLRQILLNLIGNAVKFTELGSVTLTVRLSPTNHDDLIFDVTDTGIGMSDEQKSRLFQAFEQADASTTRKFGGTGLGLRISERLATMLGGRIEVSSEPNVGSTFQLTIHAPSCRDVIQHEATSGVIDGDVTHPPTVPATASASSPAALPLQSIRILLVEDGPDNQRLISFILKKAGAEVVVVDNGLLALERLCEAGNVDAELLRPESFDIVLMDMQMPIMDGYEATRKLREKGWSGPILALTAHAMSHDMEHSLRIGCNAHLTKPIDKRALIAACAKWAQSGDACLSHEKCQ